MITKAQLESLVQDLQAVDAREGDYLAAAESALETATAMLDGLTEQENEPQTYWDRMDDYDETDGVERHNPFGPNTARIISLEAGGVIAYCHEGSADRIVQALWL